MTPVHFAVWTCPHCPFEEPISVEWLLSTLSNLRPRPRLIVCLGDLFESMAASVHPKEPDHVLEDEFESGANLLSRVREAVPYRCRYIWHHGNHDDNILRPDPRRVPKEIRSLCNWNNHAEYGKEFRRWHQVPYRKSVEGCSRLGQVIFNHGFDCGVNSDELESLQISLICGGHGHRLVVRGHTHRPVAVTQCFKTKTVPLSCHYVNAGTIGPLKPQYMTRLSSFLWGPGLVVGEADPRPNPHGGIQWQAHLLTP